DLGPARAQHPRDPVGVDAVVEEGGDVVEAEPELPQRDDPVQPFQLRRVVGAVAAGLVDAGGHEQAGRVPVPQHAVGDPADPREGSDGQHRTVLPPATVSGSSPRAGFCLPTATGTGGEPAGARPITSSARYSASTNPS